MPFTAIQKLAHKRQTRIEFYLKAPISLPRFLAFVKRTHGSSQMERICLSMQEAWVQSLGQEDPLEKEMVTHSSILA